MKDDQSMKTALARGVSMKADRRRRMAARAKRTNKTPSDENDNDAKLRSVLSAIRAHTNSDVDLSVAMSPSELFSAVLTALSGPTAERAAAESKFVGEALDLVSKLNSVLATR
jgi:hypothetical protein